jgi:tRNA-specific 2-thiouridylase
MKKNKVAIAMSGGVDSGVSAALLVKQGYRVTGFHLQLFEKATGWDSARKTAEFLGIPIKKVDLSTTFKKQVIDYFLDAYAKGLTPNPCVRCNKFIKFGELYDYVRKLDFDYLATGHYARNIDGHLFQAKDKSKDQSYFLYNLKREQLARILFPVGNMTKKEVRQMAKKCPPAGGLPVAERPESQEICFLAGKDYRQFLKRFAPESIKPGKVVDTKGRIIGNHLGLPLYTIGQRHGFRLNLKKTLPPYYVISKYTRRNQLIVGFGEETEVRKFIVNQVNLVSAKGGSALGRNQVNPGELKDLKMRIRNLGELLGCKVTDLPAGRQGLQSGRVKIILNEPERGIAPGQAAVFYSGEEVLGGGTIN